LTARERGGTAIGLDLKYLGASAVVLLVEIFIAVFVRDGLVRGSVGDILVVVLIYCLVRVFVQTRTRLLPAYIFAFAVVVEVLQGLNLVAALGLNDVPAARVIIGTTFDIADIACYLVGCAGLALVELVVRRRGSDGFVAAGSVRRVRVVGNSGSGKTTLTRKVAARLGVPHRELDEVFHAPSWERRDTDEARADLRAWLAGPGADGWVVDGNWGSKVDDLCVDVDVIVWLDYPRRVVMPRVLWRTVWRGVTGRELWHGMFSRDPRKNIVLWSWTQHRRYQEQYGTLTATEPRVVRLTGPRATRRWLAALPTSPPWLDDP